MVSRSFKTTFSIAIILLSIFPENTLYAQDRGGYTGSFLRLGLGARARALGGAFTAIPGDGYSVYYNPAGLPDLPGKEVTLSYRNLSLDRTFIYTGVALKIPPTEALRSDGSTPVSTISTAETVTEIPRRHFPTAGMDFYLHSG